MSNSSEDYDAVLSGSIGEILSEARDPSIAHPSTDQWTAYLQDNLPAVEGRQYLEHLGLCSDCLQVVLELRSFLQPEIPAKSAPAELGKVSVWRSLRRSIRRPSGWLRHGLLAALSLGLVVATTAAVWQHSQLSAMRQPTQDAAVLHLDSAIERSGGLRSMPGDASQVTLVLHPTDLRDYSAYRADLLDARGRRRWQGEVRRGACIIDSVPMTDSFCIGLHRDFLPTGEYRIDLWGRDDGEWQKVDSFALLSSAVKSR